MEITFKPKVPVELGFSTSIFAELFPNLKVAAAERFVDANYAAMNDALRLAAKRQFKTFYGIDYQPKTGAIVDNTRLIQENERLREREGDLKKRLAEAERKLAETDSSKKKGKAKAG